MAASARAVNQREILVVLRVVIGVRIILPVAGKFNSASATELMSLLMKLDAAENFGRNDQEFCAGHASLI
jgi:hypothetical protein